MTLGELKKHIHYIETVKQHVSGGAFAEQTVKAKDHMQVCFEDGTPIFDIRIDGHEETGQPTIYLCKRHGV